MPDAEPCMKGPRELSRHEKLHTGREWQCARCPAAFQKESMLRYHHEKVHLQLVSHVCQATRAKEESKAMPCFEVLDFFLWGLGGFSCSFKAPLKRPKNKNIASFDQNLNIFSSCKT
jgi:hypothetical protein